MGIEDLYKIALLLSAAFGLWVSVRSDLNGRWSRMREDYKFAKDVCAELSASSQMHPFQKAKAYLALSGDRTVGLDEGDYLFSLHDPEWAVRYFVQARKYVEYSLSKDSPKIQFKEKYRSSFSRKWRIAIYAFLYALFVILAGTPLFIGVQSFNGIAAWLITFAICLAVFGSMAVMSLKSAFRIEMAKDLVQKQSRRNDLRRDKGISSESCG